MSRQSLIFDYLLEHFSNAQLQSGLQFIVPHRQNLPEGTGHRYSRPYRIVAVTRDMKGTGIPASVFSRYRKGEVSLSAKSMHKLKLFYHRWSYNRLRTAGMSIPEAFRHYKKPPLDILKMSNLYFSYIQKIADKKKIDPFFILHGFRISNKIFEDWKFVISGGEPLSEIYEDEYLNIPDEEVPRAPNLIIPPAKDPAIHKPYRKFVFKKIPDAKQFYQILRKAKSGLLASVNILTLTTDYTKWMIQSEIIHPEFLETPPDDFHRNTIHKILEESPSLQAASRRIDKAFNRYVEYLKKGRDHEPDYTHLGTTPTKKRKKYKK